MDKKKIIAGVYALAGIFGIWKTTRYFSDKKALREANDIVEEDGGAYPEDIPGEEPDEEPESGEGPEYPGDPEVPEDPEGDPGNVTFDINPVKPEEPEGPGANTVPVKPTGSVNFSGFQLPPFDIDQFTSPVPVPGMFYQVRGGNTWTRLGKMFEIENGPLKGEMTGPIVAEALRQAIDLELTARGLPSDTATSKARRDSFKGKINEYRVKQYIELILCCPWNDSLYGTWLYGQSPNEEVSYVSSSGRSIRIKMQQVDNFRRILEGLKPARNIPLGSPQLRDQGKLSKHIRTDSETGKLYYPLLWLPPIDMDTLLGGPPGQIPESTAGMGSVELEKSVWDDEGVKDVSLSKISPPPALQARGITSYDDDLAADESWGCP